MNSLQDGRPRSFSQLTEESTFARQTVADHLKHLMGQGMVVREELKRRGRGRPSFLYRIPKALTREVTPFIPPDIVSPDFTSRS